ncbi:MAG: hypothetical protein V4598_17715 [Bdellovibrionota bacterium]
MRRILIALGISVFGLLLTWILLRPQEWKTDSVNSRQSVAVVSTLSNDVSRQEEGRLLWSPIRKGDKIYAGDKIKTAGLSSTTIQFADSKSKLDIEENSIVHVSQDKNKFSLNMLEGRVFIQGDQAKDQLNLLSAGKKIDYAGNTAISISQTGESRIESFNEESLFKDLNPAYSQNLLSAKNEIELTWRPEEKASEVNVYIGESPLLLKKIPLNGTAFHSGKIQAEMRPGVNYWQLSSMENGKEVKSTLMKLNLIRPIPPTQIFPVHKEIVMGNEKPFDFKWNKGSSTGLTTLIIAKDQDMAKIVQKEDVRDQTFYAPEKILPEGDYFWKLSFSLPSGETVDSPVTSFTVHRGSGLLSPAPLIPMEKAKFYLSAGNETEVKFEWKRQDNVTYTLKINGDNFARELESQSNFTTVTLNRPGSYRWEVSSRSADGKVSILPAQRNFDVRNENKVAWLTTQKVYNYLDNLPIVILRWQKNYNGSSILKISSTPDFKEAETFNAPGKDFPYRPSQDGIFYARVQGLDEYGTVSASSDVYDFEIKSAPLPPAPLAVNNPKKIIASSAGDFSLSMTNQKTVWLLIAQLVDAKGGVMDERRFSDSTMKFNGLLPGKYLVRTNFQDEFNRKGEVSVMELEVPEKSKIAAPKIKGIKVR